MAQPAAPIVFLNGDYLPRADASLPLEDRGLLFGEAVYEVVRAYRGTPFELAAHAARLERSLRGVGIPAQGPRGDLPKVFRDAAHGLLQRNDLHDALVYAQVTRGLAAPRGFAFADPDTTPPNVFLIAYPIAPIVTDRVPTVSLLLADDRRWPDVWMKTTMLMPNNLALNAAKRAGCDHALLVRDGVVTEANSSNAFAVIDGTLRTHPADGRILGGITRDVTLRLAHELGLRVEERAFTADELLRADEAFISSSSAEVVAVTRIAEATGVEASPHETLRHAPVGPVTTRLREAFVNCVHTQTRDRRADPTHA